MNSSSFLLSPGASLVADASVIININGTGHAADIIKAIPQPFLVTDNACIELEAGANRGHQDYARLLELVDAGIVRRVSLGAAGMKVYESLIDGSTVRTLDDGEAATIAYAHEVSGIALIDERKARSLCAESFPNLGIVMTVELLMHDVITTALGAERQADAVANALMKARMQVPHPHAERVRALIGPERAAQCPSLPRLARDTHALANAGEDFSKAVRS
jgi:predicted nucleic acid-binding protein